MKQAELVTESQKPPMPCPECQAGHLHVTMITDAEGRVIYHQPLPEHGVAYLDSG